MSPSPSHPSDFSFDSSLRQCQELTRQAGSNFVPTFRLLPAEKRRGMEILYAFNRFTDDLADAPTAGDATTQHAALSAWGDALAQVLGEPGTDMPAISPDDAPFFHSLQERFPQCDGIILLPAVRHIVDRFQVPREALFHVIDGVTDDIEPRRFETFDDTADYCHQVATAVGFASLAIWGTKEPLFSEHVVKAAQGCGIAFQWTNILRDLVEDYRNGRIYLPLEELARAGLTEKQFGSLLNRQQWLAMKKRPSNTDAGEMFAYRENMRLMEEFERKFQHLLGIQLRRCEGYFRTAETLTDLLENDGRRIFRRMFMAYHRLFEKIAARPERILLGRVRLSFRDKLLIAFRS